MKLLAVGLALAIVGIVHEYPNDFAPITNIAGMIIGLGICELILRLWRRPKI